MNRRDFTKNKATLILRMIADGHEPVEDYLFRSTQEQQRLFAIGREKQPDGTWKIIDEKITVTKNDGIKNPSDHQYCKAIDIYFVVTNPDGSVFVDYDYEKTADLAIKYHDVWVSMGGKPMIAWDNPHYGC